MADNNGSNGNGERAQYHVTFRTEPVRSNFKVAYAPASTTLDSGVAVTNVLCLASRRYQHNEEWKEQTAAIRFAFWRAAGERARNLNVGDIISVEYNPADMVANAYTKDGEAKSTIECAANGFAVVARKVGAAGSAPAEEPAPAVPQEEIPF
jgi:single-stranded DNA-binding protein